MPVPDLVTAELTLPGERSLCAFPDSCLARREAAPYLVSEVMGWNTGPRTWLRDYPLGKGIAQLRQETDHSQNSVALVVINYADRKGDHILAMGDGHRFGLYHGLTFHNEPSFGRCCGGRSGTN